MTEQEIAAAKAALEADQKALKRWQELSEQQGGIYSRDQALQQVAHYDKQIRRRLAELSEAGAL